MAGTKHWGLLLITSKFPLLRLCRSIPTLLPSDATSQAIRFPRRGRQHPRTSFSNITTSSSSTPSKTLEKLLLISLLHRPLQTKTIKKLYIFHNLTLTTVLFLLRAISTLRKPTISLVGFITSVNQNILRLHTFQIYSNFLDGEFPRLSRHRKSARLRVRAQTLKPGRCPARFMPDRRRLTVP